ncbi:domain-containing [Fusarium albosuccineum]|uniref:Domain-containing n=1 Tax=Fusarium albosuccineum TaxID=1237068 RepID=A0A8H4LA51_9HYPO|nr:domain-containing [Fusarium albosuccineum]
MATNSQVPPKNTTDINAKVSLGNCASIERYPNQIAKVSQNSFGLATPEATPAVEDGRIAADKERMAAAMRQLPEISSSKPAEIKEQVSGAADNHANDEIDVEIKRIMRCFDSSYAEILGISPNSPEKEVLAAWRHLGCMLHPKFIKHPNAEAVFKKLRSAARKMGLDDLDIDEVMYWDGEEQFDASEPDTAIDEDTIPIPPQRQRYGILCNDPANEKARSEIMKEKTLIDSFIKRNHFPKLWTVLTPNEYLKKRDSDATKSGIKDKAQAAIEASVAAVDAHVLAETYLQSITETKDRLEGLDDTTVARVEEAEQAIIAEVANALAAREVAKACAEKASLASTIQEATEAFEAAKAAHTTAADATKAANLAMNEALSLVDAAESAANSSQITIEYPWTTSQAADGSLIVGVRKQGAFGTQVCIETQEDDGRVIRRLESASDVGLLEVSRYWKMDGFKNLAGGQSQWSHKQRDDFDQLLWVTKSQTKRKNTAANKKDPNADCCVKFHQNGIQMLTTTSLSKVLGRSSATAEIRRVCERDGILPPSEAGWVSEYYDPSRVEKDPVRRRALRDSQAITPSDDHLGRQRQNPGASSEAGSRMVQQLQDKVENLENQMKDMKDITIKMDQNMAKTDQNMAALMGMFKEFMRASATIS